MKQPPIDHLVYTTLFPRPKPTDPHNFQSLLAQYLVPEVRLETQAFYGSLSSQEAKYPGLDYSHLPHRMRLSRYPWHRRLFRAIATLELTESEIAGLTRWEGTRWARERFEREQGHRVRDTTGDEIGMFVEVEERRREYTPLRHVAAAAAAAALLPDPRGELRNPNRSQQPRQPVAIVQPSEANSPASPITSSSDEENFPSVGIELNARLRAAVAQREAGEATTVMDEEWEQWLKEAVEAGGIPSPSQTTQASQGHIHGLRPALPSTLVTDMATLHPRLLVAARQGRWASIPDVLHDSVRRHLALLPTNNSTNHLLSATTLTFNSNTAPNPFLRRHSRVSSQGHTQYRPRHMTDPHRAPTPRDTQMTAEIEASVGSITTRARELEGRIERLEVESGALEIMRRRMTGESANVASG